jgi:hypothetical protein
MSHTGAPGLVRHPISTNTASSEQPSVITRYSTLAPDAAYASSGEETSLASFEIFSAAAGLRARSETAGTTSPRLKAVRSPPQCSRAPPDALLCRDAPKPIFTGNIPSLSAQNSPRTASQRVRSIAHSAKVVIFACAQPRPLTLSRWSAYFGRAPRSTGGLQHPSTLPFSPLRSHGAGKSTACSSKSSSLCSGAQAAQLDPQL